MLGYHNKPEATAETLVKDENGDIWLKTGDIAHYDDDGCCYITDRIKDLIKVKGLQLAPAEMEESLRTSPLVADAGVTSIYDDNEATEYPRAYVVPNDKECLVPGPKATKFAHDLRAFVESKHASFKWFVLFPLSLHAANPSFPSIDMRLTSSLLHNRIRGNFVIVDQIPKSPSGKILRRLLKDTKGNFVKVYEERIRAKL